MIVVVASDHWQQCSLLIEYLEGSHAMTRRQYLIRNRRGPNDDHTHYNVVADCKRI
jgi:hypothetical protein